MEDLIVKLLGDWCEGFNLGGILFKLILAVVLSAIVGSERATKRHAAGLRTFMLVSMISTLAAMLDKYLIERLHASFSLAI